MMKQQVVFVHWGDAAENYKDYRAFLQKSIYDPYAVKDKRWKDFLWKDLWKKFEVFSPAMPNKNYAQYEAWKIMFEKVFPFLEDDIILVWHSLWWTFLIKYLMENNFPRKIKGLFLVAAAIVDSEVEKLWSFNFWQNYTLVEDQVKHMVAYHSKNDGVVPYSDLKVLKKSFKNLDAKSFKEYWHFLMRDFPEIIKDIKKAPVDK